MILLLDNHDSFTWNLAQYMMELGAEVRVETSDTVTAAGVLAGGCRGIVISPGPGRPERAGIALALIGRAAGRVPILGVCLGHQAIALAYGGRVVRARRPVHGKTSPIRHDGRGVFAGMSNPFEATRYHSLVVEPGSLPSELEISAVSDDDGEEVIMGLRHRDHPLVWLEGVQFHPESILTLEGKRLMANFVKTVSEREHRGEAGRQRGVA